MEQAYNPIRRKQVIMMKNITITTYRYKVKLVYRQKRIVVCQDKTTYPPK